MSGAESQTMKTHGKKLLTNSPIHFLKDPEYWKDTHPENTRTKRIKKKKNKTFANQNPLDDNSCKSFHQNPVEASESQCKSDPQNLLLTGLGIKSVDASEPLGQSVELISNNNDIQKESSYQSRETDSSSQRKSNSWKNTEKIEYGMVSSFPCDECDFIADQTGQLKKHKEMKHESIERKIVLKCSFDSENPAYPKGLKKFDIHSICDICNYLAQNALELSIHKKNMHSKKHKKTKNSRMIKEFPSNQPQSEKKSTTRPFIKCKDCNYKARRPKKVEEHYKSEHGRTNGGVWKHESIERENTIHCNFDPEISTNPKSAERFDTVFRCDVCIYIATTPEQLEKHKKSRHAQVHSKTENTGIDKEIVPSASMQSENTKKSTKRPFIKCIYCDYSSTRPKKIEEHYKSKHGKTIGMVWKPESIESKNTTYWNFDPEISTNPKGAERFDTVFRCDVCTYIATTPEQLEKHKKSRHAKICNKTKKAGKEQEIFSKQSQNGKTSTYEQKKRSGIYFNFYDYTTTQPRKPEEHRKTYAGVLKLEKNVESKKQTNLESPRPFDTVLQCDVCAYIAINANQLRTHKRSKHAKDDNGAKNTGIIKKVTSMQQIFDSENQTKSDEKFCTVLFCDVCTYIEKHKKSRHAKIYNKTCIATNPKLLKHYKKGKHAIVHNKTRKTGIVSRPFLKCIYCDYTSNRPKKVEEHYKTHGKGFVAVPCKKCKCTVGNSSRDHLRCQHKRARRYQCDLCDFVTYEREYLNWHNESHQPNVLYPCRKCTFLTYSFKSLEKHLKKSHTEDPDPDPGFYSSSLESSNGQRRNPRKGKLPCCYSYKRPVGNCSNKVGFQSEEFIITVQAARQRNRQEKQEQLRACHRVDKENNKEIICNDCNFSMKICFIINKK